MRKYIFKRMAIILASNLSEIARKENRTNLLVDIEYGGRIGDRVYFHAHGSSSRNLSKINSSVDCLWKYLEEENPEKINELLSYMEKIASSNILLEDTE